MSEFDPGEMRFERDVRAVLAERARTPLPASLYEAARTEPAAHVRAHRAMSSFLIGASGLAVVLALSAALVLVYAKGPAGPGAGPRTFDWATGVVTLEANTVAIHVGDKAFSPPADAALHSDPGSSTYRTLEMSWSEQGIEMRLNIYLAADDSNWWVSEIRTYDGLTPGNWIYYQAPSVKAARGDSYEGNLDLNGTSDASSGRLTINGLRLTAFAALKPQTCTPAGPTAPPGNAPAGAKFNPDLSGLSIATGMDAAEAGAELDSAGICYEFRYEYPASNQGQIWCTNPPGVIREWTFDSAGRLLVFVEAPPDETIAPDAPQSVNCGSAYGTP